MDKGKGLSNPKIGAQPHNESKGDINLNKYELDLYRQKMAFESYYNDQMRKLTKEKAKHKSVVLTKADTQFTKRMCPKPKLLGKTVRLESHSPSVSTPLRRVPDLGMKF